MKKSKIKKGPTGIATDSVPPKVLFDEGTVESMELELPTSENDIRHLGFWIAFWEAVVPMAIRENCVNTNRTNKARDKPAQRRVPATRLHGDGTDISASTQCRAGSGCACMLKDIDREQVALRTFSIDMGTVSRHDTDNFAVK